MDYDVIIKKTGEEYKAINELMDNLRDKMEHRPQSQLEAWTSEMKALFSQLLIHVKGFFEIEEQDGFMTTVIQERPTLAPAVETLRQEHQTVLSAMERIQQQCRQAGSPDCQAIDSLCKQLGDVIQYLKTHVRKENQLIQGALASDIGAQD
ncbi:MAG: hemerythrin domain-containing protein [Candidatus Omnitrophota bacterium]